MGRYNLGDLVMVLPYDEIARKCVYGTQLPSGCNFVGSMKQYCEREFVIISVDDNKTVAGTEVGYYRLENTNGWFFTDEMLEDVSSALETVVCEFSFDSLFNGTENDSKASSSFDYKM